MNNALVAVAVLPILVIVGIYALPPAIDALFATLQELARAYPVATFIALIVSVGMTLYFAFAKR